MTGNGDNEHLKHVAEQFIRGIIEEDRKRPRVWRLNENHTVTPIEGDAVAAALQAAEEDQYGKRVGHDVLNGFIVVSTIFLSWDHGFMGPPRLFETVVFTDHGVGLRDILDQRRYSTWDEAVAGHKEAVEKVRQTGMRDEIALHSKKETS